MNYNRTLSAALVLAGVLASHAADASIITNPNLGTLTNGETSYFSTPGATVTIGVNSYSVNDVVTGVLSAGSQIVFTYKGYTNPTAYVDANFGGPGGNSINLTSIFGSTTETAQPGFLVPPPGANLDVTTSLNPGDGTFTTTIANLTGGAVTFTSGIETTPPTSSKFEVSGVPLPPSLILFATGLFLTAGFLATRKARN